MNPHPEAHTAPPDDEGVVLWLTFFVGALPAACALFRGAVWGAEPTIGLLLCLLAVAGLAARARDGLHERRLARETQGRRS